MYNIIRQGRRLFKIRFLVDLNIRKQKWLITCDYNLHKAMINEYLEYIIKRIESHSSKHDLNPKPTEDAKKSFCQINNFKNELDIARSNK